MRKKGLTGEVSPEKMPVTTTGIEMTRGSLRPRAPERLTGGNTAADESNVAQLVLDYMNMDAVD